MSSTTSPTKVPPMKPPRLQKCMSVSYDGHSPSVPILPPQGSPTHSSTKHSSQQDSPASISNSTQGSPASKHSQQGSPASFNFRHSPDDSPTSIHSKHSQGSPASRHSLQGSPALLHSKSSPGDSPAIQNKQYSPKTSPILIPKQDHETAKKSLVAALAMAEAKQRAHSNPKPPPDPLVVNTHPPTSSNESSHCHTHQNGECIRGDSDSKRPPQQVHGNVPLKPNPPPVCVKPPPPQEAKTPPTTKRPLLPPVDPPSYKTRTVSQPVPSPNSNRLSPTPSPTQKKRYMNRSESSDDRSPPKLKPMPRTKSHDDRVIAPEDVAKVPVVVDIGSSISSDPFEEESGVIHGNIVIPVSPTSTTSDVPPDDSVLPDSNSPVFVEGTGTQEPHEDSTVLERSAVTTPTPTDKNDKDDETDGMKKVKSSAKPHIVTKPMAKGVGKGIRSKGTITIKEDTSWIKSKKEDNTPPTSPSVQATPTPAPPTTTTNTTDTKSSSNRKTVTPYRSIAILPDKPSSLSSSELLHNTSKPLIGPSGQYYPPAVRTKTQDPQTHQTTTGSSGGMGLRKVKSNDRVLSVAFEENEGHTTTINSSSTPSNNDDEIFKQKNDIPKRFKMTRRSNSFTDKKGARPVSMMDDVMSKDKKKQKFSTSTTMTRSMTDAARKEMLKEEAKEKKPKSTSKLMGLFSRRGKHESVSVIPDEDECSSSSSDDDVGGTITRMPKKTFNRTPWEPQISDPGDVDEPPEYDQLFEYVFVLGLKEDRSSKKLQTETLYKYPPASKEFAKDDALRSIDQFCFPDIEQWKPVLSYQSENYSFVLTSLTGTRRFGYCRRLLPKGSEARLPEVYCIISPLGCFDLYSKLLDHIEQRRAISKAAVYSFLSSVVANRFPAPGRTVRIKVLPARDIEMEILELRRSHDSRLEHVDFAELYNTLGPKMLIQVFSSFLMERRIILAAQRLSKLSSCCHAFLALLYPFEWQHTFIPVLPNSLIDFCGSPLPFVIGISPTMAKNLNKLDIEMEEALIVDLDKKKFIKEFGDESSILPNKLFQYLKSRLEATVITNEYSKPPTHRSGQGKADKMVVTAFMTVFAYFFGDLKSFLEVTDTATGEMRLQKQEFIKSFQSKSTKRFLEAFLMTQMFDKFVEERESPKKAATISQGLFEKELPNLMEKMPEIELFSRKKFWQKRKPPR